MNVYCLELRGIYMAPSTRSDHLFAMIKEPGIMIPVN
jgi:hypothetical protein